MIASQPQPTTVQQASQHRRQLRRVAAGLSGLMAIAYYLIGAGVITVVETTDTGVDLVVFGVGAGTIFAIGATLLLTVDRRALWAAGAVLQLGIIAMYFNVGSERTPVFEAWGMSLRVGQLLLFGMLAYLAVRPPPAAVDPTANGGSRPTAGRPA